MTRLTYARAPLTVRVGEAAKVELPPRVLRVRLTGFLFERGVERSRITAANGSAIPLDNPAVIAFDDARKSILVTNHAIFGDPAHFAVLRIFVGERGAAGPDDDCE